MDSSASVLLSSPSKLKNHQETNSHIQKGGIAPFIDSSYMQKQSHVPTGFIWPERHLVAALEELNEPLVDLKGFFKGDAVATEHAAKCIKASTPMVASAPPCVTTWTTSMSPLLKP
ncbi:hypothetical protein ACFX13_012677 [Malus domestica]